MRAKKAVQVVSVKNQDEIVKPDFVFNHNHYVPILKSKQGELWALKSLKPASRALVTPLIELHRADDAKALAAKIGKNLAEIWKGRPFFLDARLWGTSTPTEVDSARSVFQSMRATQGLFYVPVTGLARSTAYQQLIAKVADDGGSGVVLRLSMADLASSATLRERISALLQVLKCTPTSMDLVIDYGSQQDRSVLAGLIRAGLGAVPFVSDWRTLTVAAGSFPSSLNPLPPDKWIELGREEWQGWRAALGSGSKLPRIPAFGDYGIRDTAPPPAFGSPAPNLRYTIDGKFLVRRGKTLVKDGGSDEIFPICASLAKRGEFRGSAFSMGDAEIAQRASSQLSPGNPGSWVAWGMNHHLEIVASEIQSPLFP